MDSPGYIFCTGVLGENSRGWMVCIECTLELSIIRRPLRCEHTRMEVKKHTASLSLSLFASPFFAFFLLCDPVEELSLPESLVS